MEINHTITLEKSGINIPIILLKEVKEKYNIDLNNMKRDTSIVVKNLIISSYNNGINIKQKD